MNGQVIILSHPGARALAHRLIDSAPDRASVSIKAETRSDQANRKMWAMLGDIAKAQPMSRKHTPDDWKAIFMNACGWECQFIEGLDGRPFPQGFRSSRMTVKQMSALIEFMYAWGAEHGIRWSEPNPYASN